MLTSGAISADQVAGMVGNIADDMDTCPHAGAADNAAVFVKALHDHAGALSALASDIQAEQQRVDSP